jgi:hypothetical protein
MKNKRNRGHGKEKKIKGWFDGKIVFGKFLFCFG